MKSLIHHLAIVALVVGCNAEDEKVFESGGNIETKPQATQLAALAADAASGGGPAHKSVDVTYKVKVTSNSEAELCKGEVQITVMSDLSLNLPEAKLLCASLTIDLAGVFGAVGGGGSGGGGGGLQNGLKSIVHDGKVLRFSEFAGAKFDPPRPFILGPIITDNNKYKGFKETTKHTLTATDSQTGQTITADGTFTIKVIDHKTTYEYGKNKFDNVLHWTLDAKGFDVPGKYGLTIQQFEWFYNTRPLMIPGIRIKGALSDFITGEGSESTAKLAGTLLIEIDVLEYHIL